MEKYFLFTVNDNSWPEHKSTGVAAINDPVATAGQSYGLPKRQSAMCEMAGIQPNDIILFYFQGKKEIHGLYKATSEAFFDEDDLVSGGFINSRFPIRVRFSPYIEFKRNLVMDEIWEMKDRGEFCSIQQQRGDAVGRHACLGLLKTDGDALVRMFYEKNPIYRIITGHPINNYHEPLPFEYRTSSGGTRLHYESVLQSVLIKDFVKCKHKNIFGDYDYFIPYFPTGAQKEIDLFLVKHQNNEPIWYTLIEIKPDKFDLGEIKALSNYENWIIRSLTRNNPRMVHTYALAYSFDHDIKTYVSERVKYTDRRIHLVEYLFDDDKKAVDLKEI